MSFNATSIAFLLKSMLNESIEAELIAGIVWLKRPAVQITTRHDKTSFFLF
jgi:hypothetical protein